MLAVVAWQMDWFGFKKEPEKSQPKRTVTTKRVTEKKPTVSLEEIKTRTDQMEQKLAELEKLLILQRGSSEAFEVLVNRYMKDAYFIALGLVGNREDAMDLSQEAFVRAYRHIKDVKPGRKFFPWFYQILKNLCVSHLRKRRYRQASSLNSENCPEVASTADCFSPEEVAKRNETKDFSCHGKRECRLSINEFG